MPPKIERIWGSIFEYPSIKRRDSTQKENPQDQHQQSKDQEDKSPEADRESVEKAIVALNASEAFKNSGIQAELLVRQVGLFVKMLQNNGNVIKVLPANDFIKLHQFANSENSRGKILDQKF